MKKIKWLFIFMIAVLFYSCSTDDDNGDPASMMYNRVMKFRNDYNTRNESALLSNIHPDRGNQADLVFWDGVLGNNNQVSIDLTIDSINTATNTVAARISGSSPSLLDNSDITFTMKEDGSDNWKIFSISGAVTF